MRLLRLVNRSFWSGVFLLLAVLCIAALRPAMAQGADGVDITNDVGDFINTVLTVAIFTLVYIVRGWAREHMGLQLDDKDVQVVETALVDSAHRWINAHLLSGRPIVVKTPSAAAMQIAAELNDAYPAEVKRLGLTPVALTARAEGAVAKVLNLMPAAPPFAPAKPAPAIPAST